MFVGLEKRKSVDLKVKVYVEVEGVDGFASGSGVRTGRNWSIGFQVRRRELQLPSAAELPKQDREERPSAKH